MLNNRAVPSSSYITVTVTDHDTPLISSTYIPQPSPSPNGADTGVIVSAVLTVVMVGGLLVVAFIFVRRSRKKAISQKENSLAYPEKPGESLGKQQPFRFEFVIRSVGTPNMEERSIRHDVG